MLPIGRKHYGFSVAGFTLLELLLVLAILALVSALIIPGLSESDSRSLQKQIREAQSVLNFARRKAIIDGVPVAATFQSSIMGNDERSPQDWVSEGAVVQKTNVHGEKLPAAQLAVVFFPEGGSTGGTLELSQGDLLSKIHVDSITGKIKLIDDE